MKLLYRLIEKHWNFCMELVLLFNIIFPDFLILIPMNLKQFCSICSTTDPTFSFDEISFPRTKEKAERKKFWWNHSEMFHSKRFLRGFEDASSERYLDHSKNIHQIPQKALWPGLVRMRLSDSLEKRRRLLNTRPRSVLPLQAKEAKHSFGVL